MNAGSEMAPGEQPVRVWDLPTRVFHWLLAGLVVFSVVTATIGGNAMVWHMRSGFAIFTLLAFRLVWGFAGGHWSRFRAFVYAPSTSLRYLRGESLPHEHHQVGHNPLGAGSVFALLGILALQVATGLIADDEIATTGPLIKYVSSATSSLATSWHKNYGKWIIIGLVRAAPRRDRLLLVPAPAEPGRADVAWRQAADGRRAPGGRQRPVADDRPRDPPRLRARA